MPGAAQELEYVLVLVTALVGSALSWSHYYLWLVMPIAVVLFGKGSMQDDSWTRRGGWAAVLLSAPAVTLVHVENPALQALYTYVAVSHLFFAGLMMFLLLVRLCVRQGFSPELSLSANVAAGSGGLCTRRVDA
jgi:hypothetical protein